MSLIDLFEAPARLFVDWMFSLFEWWKKSWKSSWKSTGRSFNMWNSSFWKSWVRSIKKKKKYTPSEWIKKSMSNAIKIRKSYWWLKSWYKKRKNTNFRF